MRVPVPAPRSAHGSLTWLLGLLPTLLLLTSSLLAGSATAATPKEVRDNAVTFLNGHLQTVFLDGKNLGNTPVNLEDEEPGIRNEFRSGIEGGARQGLAWVSQSRLPGYISELSE